MTRVMGLKKEYWTYSKYASFAVSFGVTMAASIFLGYFGGSWLDGKLGTGPIFLVIGLLLGVAVAFYSLFKELKTLERMRDPFKPGNGDAGDA
ncbi:MAG: AtpZ/AtpI family protein [Clostridia bacterium]|nr:AtpZ/AtpI family protein [Clostridia bacterium]